jgi:hypothetical protein
MTRLAGYIRSGLPPTVLSSANAVIHEVGSTAVCATAEDVARFMLALLGSPPSTSVPIISPSGLKQRCASGLRCERNAGPRIVFAPPTICAVRRPQGDTGGFHGMLALLSEERFGFFVLYNSASAHNAFASAGAELLDTIAARYFPDANLDLQRNACRTC